MTEVDKQFFNFLKNKKSELTINEIFLALCNKSDIASNFLGGVLNEYEKLGFAKLVKYFKNNIYLERKFYNLQKELMGQYEYLIDAFFKITNQCGINFNSLDFLMFIFNTSNAVDLFEREMAKAFSIEYDDEYEDVEKIKSIIIDGLNTNSKLYPFISELTKSNNYLLNYNLNNKPIEIPNFISFKRLIEEKRKNSLSSKDIANILKKSIIGQDKICDDIASQHLVRATNNFSVTNTTCPEAILFCGPSGTGKTKLANVIAKEFFGNRICKINGAEFGKEDKVNNLFGSAVGYVGSEAKSPFVTFLQNLAEENAKGVILLDEVEKMNRDVQNSLLNLLNGDDSDALQATGSGKNAEFSWDKINFNNVFVIATSNIASAELEKSTPKIGFSNKQQKDIDKFKTVKEAALKSGMKIEFFNRFSGGVYIFNTLTEEDRLNIAKLNCKQLKTQIAEKYPDLKVKIDDTAIKLMAMQAQIETNTRTLDNISFNQIDNLLTEALLCGNSDVENTEYIVKAKDDKLVVEENGEIEQEIRRKANA